MAGTQTWRVSRIGAAHGRARIWTLLNAQALLNGTAGTPDGAALIEDDRWRMAVRRAN
jgi:hypothetical protein